MLALLGIGKCRPETTGGEIRVQNFGDKRICNIKIDIRSANAVYNELQLFEWLFVVSKERISSQRCEIVPYRLAFLPKWTR